VAQEGLIFQLLASLATLAAGFKFKVQFEFSN
jgi:hypothetical protein